MTVTIDIPRDLEQKLREEAARHGQDLPTYIQQVLAGQVGRNGQPAKNSIMQLHGIGKDAWQGVDIEEYVRKSRDEWDNPA